MMSVSLVRYAGRRPLSKNDAVLELTRFSRINAVFYARFLVGREFSFAQGREGLAMSAGIYAQIALNIAKWLNMSEVDPRAGYH